MRRGDVQELRVLRSEGMAYIGSFSAPVGANRGPNGGRFIVSWPLGELLLTQDGLVFSLGLGLSRMVRPWLLDRADVQFFESWGSTVWLTESDGSTWRFWSPKAAELVAQLESHGYRRRVLGGRG